MKRARKRKRGIKGRPWYRRATGSWYIKHNGKPIPVVDERGDPVRGAENRERADKCWVLMQARMMAPARPEENPVRLVFAMFLDNHQKAHPTSYKDYQRTLVGFANSLPSHDFLARDLRACHVDAWVNSHPEWNSTTRATYISRVLAALNWAVEPHQGLMQSNPLMKYPLPRRRARGEEALVPEEAHDAFLDHVPDDFKTILLVLRDTGTRPGNVCRVTATHCIWDKGGWWFAEGNVGEDGKVHKTFEKTGKGLFVPVSEEVMELCRKLAQEHPEGPLFRTKSGDPWTPDKITWRFGYYREKLAKAGIVMPKTYFAYCYRHNLATELLEDGVPVEHVAAILGNTPSVVHRHYSHIIAKREMLTEVLRGHLKDRARARSRQASAAAEGQSEGDAEHEGQGGGPAPAAEGEPAS